MKERFRGNRREARRIKDLDSMHLLMPYFLSKRCDSEVHMNIKLDITDAIKYISEKNMREDKNVKLFHLMISAIAKTFLLRPQLNRFISGKHYYERYDVSLAFVIKKEFSDKGEESLMILIAKEDMTMDSISSEINREVAKVRETGGNDLDSLFNNLAKLPRPILILFSWILKVLEYHGIMPESLRKMDPYYSTVFIANLGSIKIGAPYHHLTEYGTNSVFITVGEIHKQAIPDREGNLILRDVLEIGVTLDERIADGYYFAKSIKLLKYLIKNPQHLEKSFSEEVNYDV